MRIILAIVVLGLAGQAWAHYDPMSGPWDGPEALSFQPQRQKDHPNGGTFLVSVYKKFISPIDGSNCPMYPSDSRYAVECFQKHGFFMGWVMTVDRLYRCGRDELKRSPTVKVAGQPRCFDPVANNDFWWSHGEQ
jgi:putative component of membrane protein insertase Oxa1/YidC/SpoIIIJ protein YidD